MMNTQIKLSFNLILRKAAFIFAFAIVASHLVHAETQNNSKKNLEAYFATGINCLKQADRVCAQVAAANIPSQSAYSKIIKGLTAALDGDFDTTFRELLPLQADKTLTPQASASLHASLALAYENQNDALRTLEQRVMAEAALAMATPPNQDDINSNQANIWETLSVLSTSNLVEMRGNSPDTNIQGWIDLALAAKFLDDGENNEKAIEQWRRAYKDHPANKGIAATLFPAGAPKTENHRAKLKGSVALVLPFSNTELYPIADAIERGFMAAKSIAGDNANVKLYPTQADADSARKSQQTAISDAIQYIVGPLTLAEVNAIKSNASAIVTLTFAQPDSAAGNPSQLNDGLLTHDEVAQIVKKARNLGMQKAAIIAADNATSRNMAATFTETWLAAGGEGKTLMSEDLDTLKKQLSEYPVDMFFIATDATSTKDLRQIIGINTPTFATSKIYSGLAANPEDATLKAIRFTDMPWMLDRENPAFSAYKKAAADLPSGEMQRWFALGADAYQVLLAQDKLQEKLSDKAIIIKGLTGNIEIKAHGEISRTFSFASFGSDGVVLETSQ